MGSYAAVTMNVMVVPVAKKVSKARRRLGYEVRHIRLPPETIVAQTKEYISPWPIFSPWTVADFQAAYLPVSRFTAGTPERAYTLTCFARYAKHLAGDFAESGVYQGGSAYLVCRSLQDTNKKLYLFDSFQGLPKPDSNRDPYFQEGQYAASLGAAQERLKDFERFTDFRVGWIPDFFLGLENNRYAFAHIDLDLYQPTLDSCRYFYPRMTSGASCYSTNTVFHRLTAKNWRLMNSLPTKRKGPPR